MLQLLVKGLCATYVECIRLYIYMNLYLEQVPAVPVYVSERLKTVFMEKLFLSPRSEKFAI